MEYDDIVGKMFGRLLVLEYLGCFIKANTKNKRRYYKCKCKCENNTIMVVDRYKLLSGHTTSCGCKAKESVTKRNLEDNPSKYYVRKVNESYIDGFGVGHIKMSNTDNEMLCDVDCIEELLKYYWHERVGYARSSFGTKHLWAHRIIMGLDNYDTNTQVDHINGNTLDNRRQNLRIVTSRQNGMNSSLRKDNTSGVAGVCWDKRRRKWLVRIGLDNKEKTIGYYSDFDSAVKSRKEAEDKYYGEYSYGNSRGGWK